MISGVKIEEEFIDLVDDGVGPRVGPIDFVHDDHDGEMPRECLRKYVPRLGHRPLGGIDEQKNSVDEGERPLHFTAEISVAGCVDEVA
jgi:hypothetical protein